MNPGGAHSDQPQHKCMFTGSHTVPRKKRRMSRGRTVFKQANKHVQEGKLFSNSFGDRKKGNELEQMSSSSKDGEALSSVIHGSCWGS